MPDTSQPEISDVERQQIPSHSPLRAGLIHQIIRQEGEAALKRPNNALAWSGFAAGLSMGFSFLTMALIRAALPPAPWQHLISSFGYSMGFLIVVLGRQQLFTESTLTAVLPALHHREMRVLLQTFRLWGVVLAANLFGTFLFAWAISHHDLFKPEVWQALVDITEESLNRPFWSVLIMGIFAGWLIALMVWLLPSAGSARMFIILILTYVVALGGMSHIIAGSVEAFFALLTDRSDIPGYFLHFLAPTLIGNTIGGVSLVAILNHAPVAADLENEQSSN